MNRTNFFLLLFTLVTLIIMAASLFYFSNNFPKVFDVEHAQQVYEKTITNPHPMSAEEVTTFIGLSIETHKSGQKMMESLIEVIKSFGFMLLILAFNISLIIISIYRRKNHENR